MISVKNFLSADECAALNAAASQGVLDGWVGPGIVNSAGEKTTLRMTSRLYMNGHEYPDVVGLASAKVRSYMGIHVFPLIGPPHGKDGVVVSVTREGGDVYPHRDPTQEGFVCFRCNVMTQAPDAGGKLTLDGVEQNIEVGELHCYPASLVEHSVSVVEGTTPRILWMFGAYVPVDTYNWKYPPLPTP
jgi:hypothetical protein